MILFTIRLALIVLLILYLIRSLMYRYETSEFQKISYIQYLKISSVAPEKWEISDSWYYYLYYCPREGDYNCIEIFMKSYFDMLRLRSLYKKKQKKKFNTVYIKKRAELIKQWQKDIDNYHNDYLEQIGVYLGQGKKL